MIYAFAFLSGLLFANGIPHFINGISGREFHAPSLHGALPGIPSPLFNAVWGILNFAAALLLGSLCPGLSVGANLLFTAFAFGFVFAALGLSVYFPRRNKNRAT